MFNFNSKICERKVNKQITYNFLFAANQVQQEYKQTYVVDYFKMPSKTFTKS